MAIKSRRIWTRNELILAFNLYCKTPFGKIHTRNPDIITLAKILDRTPSAVSWKLANFARLDPSLQEREISGAGHGAKLEEEIWQEFNDNWETLSFESERLMNEQKLLHHMPLETIAFPEGKVRENTVRVRINQSFFRSVVLATYDARCCITGIGLSELLCASHIIPWSVDSKNRTNPQNGLCLNALHDRAFDRGLLTVTPDYKVRISPTVSKFASKATSQLLSSYDGAEIIIPSRFRPDPIFLRYHNEKIYRAS